jgi:hypothetical protein
MRLWYYGSTDFDVPDGEKPKLLVLDGQQRLQSLFIGLCGSYEGKELFLDILSGELREPEDVKYTFRFLDPAKAQPPWLKFTDVVFSERTYDDLGDQLPDEPSLDDQRKFRRHVAQVVVRALSSAGRPWPTKRQDCPTGARGTTVCPLCAFVTSFANSEREYTVRRSKAGFR